MSHVMNIWKRAAGGRGGACVRARVGLSARARLSLICPPNERVCALKGVYLSKWRPGGDYG